MKVVLILVITLAVYTNAQWQFNNWRKKVMSQFKCLDQEYCKEKFFMQILDHNNLTNTVIWKQRYFMNNKYYKEDGPIFLNVGGEQLAYPSELGDETFLGMLAKKFKAKIFLLEHRFYGMSRPTDDTSLDNLIYLSSEQALADIAYFIKEMRNVYNIPPTTKWILVGCSYAASLVAWMRLKYPHLVHGGIADSGPLVAEVDFKDYLLAAEDAFRNHSPDCFEILTSAFQEFHNMLSNKTSWDELERKFNICYPPHYLNNHTTEKDVTIFYQTIMGIIHTVINNNDETSDMAMENVCEYLEDDTTRTPIDRLAELNELILEKYFEDCLNVNNYTVYINERQRKEWNCGHSNCWERPWLYQTCSEFAWYQTSSARPFSIPDNSIPVDYFKQQCIDLFNFSDKGLIEMNVERTNLMYDELDIVNVTSNVVFVYGSNDAWRAAGVAKSNNPKCPVLHVKDKGHCPLVSIMSELDKNDVELVRAFQQVEEFIALLLQD